MGLFPMCLSKYSHTHMHLEREQREKRKRREREREREERKEEKEKLGESPKSKPKEAIESSTKLEEVRKIYFLYMCMLGFLVLISKLDLPC